MLFFFAHSPISMSICWSPSDPSRFCCSSAFPDTWRRPTTVWPRLFVCGNGLPESIFFSWSILIYYNYIQKNINIYWYRLWFIKFYCHDHVSSWFSMIFPYMIMFQHAPLRPIAGWKTPSGPPVARTWVEARWRWPPQFIPSRTKWNPGECGENTSIIWEKTWNNILKTCVYLLKKGLLCININQTDFWKSVKNIYKYEY